MKNLETVTTECKDICRLNNIPIDFDAPVSWDKKMKSKWGICQTRNGKHTIRISINLSDERIPEDALKTTVLHELLHSCEGCQNHGRIWKRYANRLNRKYGLNIKRTTSFEEKNTEETLIEAIKKARYALMCEGCRKVQIRQRESNFTRHPERYTCRLCGKSFKKVFINKDNQMCFR